MCTNYSTRVSVDATLKESFESKVFKPRKHPGTARVKVASIPPDIQKAIKIVLQDSGAKSLYQESLKLSNYLRSRLLPPEEGDIDLKAQKIYDKVAEKTFSKFDKELSQDEFEKYNQQVYSSL